MQIYESHHQSFFRFRPRRIFFVFSSKMYLRYSASDIPDNFVCEVVKVVSAGMIGIRFDNLRGSYSAMKNLIIDFYRHCEPQWQLPREQMNCGTACVLYRNYNAVRCEVVYVDIDGCAEVYLVDSDELTFCDAENLYRPHPLTATIPVLIFFCEIFGLGQLDALEGRDVLEAEILRAVQEVAGEEEEAVEEGAENDDDGEGFVGEAIAVDDDDVEEEERNGHDRAVFTGLTLSRDNALPLIRLFKNIRDTETGEIDFIDVGELVIRVFDVPYVEPQDTEE